MQETKTYYFGIHPNVLEPVNLEFSSFGALWYEENKQRYVVGYGFGASQIVKLVQFSNSSAYVTCNDNQVLYEVYRSIRDQQQAQDWCTRRGLPVLASFREPWKNMNDGWYILRSRSMFPLHLSIVHKTKYRVWLEHSAVCESEAELAEYLVKAKQTHHLRSLEPTNIQGGSIHG